MQPKFKEYWASMQTGGLVDLMLYMEEYSRTLAKNMPLIFTQPFDAVHDNIGKLFQNDLLT
jgi:hypothetical protein